MSIGLIFINSNSVYIIFYSPYFSNLNVSRLLVIFFQLYSISYAAWYCKQLFVIVLFKFTVIINTLACSAHYFTIDILPHYFIVHWLQITKDHIFTNSTHHCSDILRLVQITYNILFTLCMISIYYYLHLHCTL